MTDFFWNTIKKNIIFYSTLLYFYDSRTRTLFCMILQKMAPYVYSYGKMAHVRNNLISTFGFEF